MFDLNWTLDAMDVTDPTDHTASPNARRVRQLSTSYALKFSVILSFAFTPIAHSQVVEVAQEPTLASFETPRPIHPVQTQGNADEPKSEQASPQSDKTNQEAASPNAAAKKNPSFIPPQRPIGQVNIDLRPKPKNGSTKVPDSLADETMPAGAVYASTSDEMQSELFYIKSRNRDDIFAYQPLYFEEVNLERYGRTCGHLQPAVSSLRFFATIPLLPYAMTAYHPSTTYTRKWPYEAGWGAPRVRELEPIELKPSLVQAGAITGLVFVLP
ncbi:MAG: hypothetical protein SFV81_07110 [Pirellulaceae bacterium]|nr:hypothetical protein [Pirellulaceae bacterium]